MRRFRWRIERNRPRLCGSIPVSITLTFRSTLHGKQDSPGIHRRQRPLDLGLAVALSRRCAASPDVEMTAVCTTRPETAEEARKAFGAKLAFTDFREMVASKEIDAVAVVVRVPSHYEPTKAAIEAGKHVYTEWPLGRTTAEAEELAALARAKGVQTASACNRG